MKRTQVTRGLVQLGALLAVLALVFAGCSNPTGGSNPYFPYMQPQTPLTDKEKLEILLGCDLVDNGDGTFTIPENWEGKILIPDGVTVSSSNLSCLQKELDGEELKTYLVLSELTDGDEVEITILGYAFYITKNDDETVFTLPGGFEYAIVEEDGSYTIKKTDRQLVEDFLASLEGSLNGYEQNEDKTWSRAFSYDDGAEIRILLPVFPELQVKVNGKAVEPNETEVVLTLDPGKETKILIEVKTLKGENGSVTLMVTRDSFFPITEIVLTPSEATLILGGDEGDDTCTIIATTATADPEKEPTHNSIEWYSSAETVAAVNANGVVTALSRGTAEIIAKAKDQEGSKLVESEPILITVLSGDASFKKFTVDGTDVINTNFTISVGNDVESVEIVYEINDPVTTITWKEVSGFESLVLEGLINPVFNVNLKVGKNKLTMDLTAESGRKKTYTLEITREEPGAILVESITLSPGSLVMTVRDTWDLSIGIVPGNATNKSVTWISSDPAVAKVENGRVTAIKSGEANIRAIAADSGLAESNSVKITVRSDAADLTNLKVGNDSVTGTYPNFSASAGKGSTAEITFALSDKATAACSSDETASVEQTSAVSFSVSDLAVGQNKFTITVTAENGSTREYYLTITRERTPVEKVEMSPTSLTLTAEGEPYTLKATVTPDDATNKTVIWTISGNAGVVTVSDEGKVTPLSRGTVRIRATAADGSNEYAEAVVIVQSGEAGLSALKVDGKDAGGTSPNFTANVGIKDTVPVAFNKSLGAKAAYQVKSASGNFNAIEEQSCSFTVTNLEVEETTVKITVTSENGKNEQEYTLVITRDSTPVGSISLTPNPMTLSSQGATGTFTATILPQGVTNPSLEWISSNALIATVDQNGKVTAVAAGPATITASAKDGSGKAGSATVNVQSWDAGLTNLMVGTVSASGTSPDFAATVENTDETVTVSFIKHAKATAAYRNILVPGGGPVGITGSSFAVNLTTGINVFVITVTAENDTAKDYTLTITRRGSGSIIFEWDNTGQSLINPDGGLTLSKGAGEKVILTGPANAGTYMWIVDADYRNPVSRERSYTFDSAEWALGKYNVSLWVNTSIGGDTVEITVKN